MNLQELDRLNKAIAGCDCLGINKCKGHARIVRTMKVKDLPKESICKIERLEQYLRFVILVMAMVVLNMNLVQMNVMIAKQQVLLKR